MLHHICYRGFLPYKYSTLKPLGSPFLWRFLVPTGSRRFQFKSDLKQLMRKGLISKFYLNNHPRASSSWPLAPSICLRMSLHSNRGHGLSLSTGFVWRPLSSYLHPTFRQYVAFCFAFGRTWSGTTAQNSETFVNSSPTSTQIVV